MNQFYEITHNGRTYILIDAASYSDYSNYSIGLANARVIAGLIPTELSKLNWISYGDLDLGRGAGNDGKLVTYEEYSFWGTDDVILAIGGHGTTAVLVRADWKETADIVAALADYPVLDDEALCCVEMEIEEESWSNWIAYDLQSALEELAEDEDEADKLMGGTTDEELREAYYRAKETTGEYGHAENTSWYIDISKIARAVYSDLKSKW